MKPIPPPRAAPLLPLALLALAALLPLCGCLSASSQGLDRAETSARLGVLKRFPDENLANLRLRQIELLDRNAINGRTYGVEFEDVSTITVVTNAGSRTRFVRLVHAQVAPDGRVSNVTESAPPPTRKAKR